MYSLFSPLQVQPGSSLLSALLCVSLPSASEKARRAHFDRPRCAVLQGHSAPPCLQQRSGDECTSTCTLFSPSRSVNTAPPPSACRGPPLCLLLNEGGAGVTGKRRLSVVDVPMRNTQLGGRKRGSDGWWQAGSATSSKNKPLHTCKH